MFENKEYLKLLGEAIKYGIIESHKRVMWWFTLVFILSIIVSWVTGGFDYDNTDAGDSRSGLSLYTDNKTGCQYLGTKYGGLIPRLDDHGLHICNQL